MNATEHTYYFSFSFNGPDGESMVFNFDCPDNTEFKDVQMRFDRFLSAVYGYETGAYAVFNKPVTVDPEEWASAVNEAVKNLKNPISTATDPRSWF